MTLKEAVQIRKDPAMYSNEDRKIESSVVMQFADVLDTEFTSTTRHLAENELQRMGINFNDFSVIRDKDGVSVWRVKNESDSFVLKCFAKREHRREITNYQILNSLDIPTLRVIAHTDYAILLEDIETSSYRFGTDEDLSDPKTVVLIAEWYIKLHGNGR